MQIVSAFPTEQRAVVPAVTPDRATDFFGLNSIFGESLIISFHLRYLITYLARFHIHNN